MVKPETQVQECKMRFQWVKRDGSLGRGLQAKGKREGAPEGELGLPHRCRRLPRAVQTGHLPLTQWPRARAVGADQVWDMAPQRPAWVSLDLLLNFSVSAYS